MQQHTAIQIQNLSVRFIKDAQKFDAVKNISFTINKGQTLALVGMSGSGKSITSLAIMGLLPQQAQINGHIFLDNNTDILQCSKQERININGKKISMIFQEPMSALNPIMSIGKQLVESIVTHQKINKKSALNQAIFWLDKVQLPHPDDIFNRFPHQLSGGQKQRVMIAMAMCNKPDLLIADEPTTALDVLVQKDIIQLMKNLQSELGMAILFITHDIDLAHLIADEIIEIKNGVLIPYHKKHFNNNIFSSPPTDNVKSILVQINNLTVQFPQPNNRTLNALNNVSLSIFEGEILGLVGASGCGKSTLSKCILGLQQYISGTIFFGEKDMRLMSRKERSRCVQMVFQDPYSSLNPRMCVQDALLEILQMHRPEISDPKKEINRLLALVELPEDAAKKYPHEFSGGQRQRICIAKAMAVQPQLIICDESVAALDTVIQEQILQLLSNINRNTGITFLFISHDLNVVSRLCNKIAVMNNGKIIELGNTQDIIGNPKEIYTEKLLKASLLG